MKTETAIPPKNARRIWRVADLPKDRRPVAYEIRNTDGSVRVCLLSKRKRQIMDLLIDAPVYCASPVRISDIVHVLKRETGVEVETEYFAGDPNTGAGAFGVYFMISKVRRLDGMEVAA